MDPIIERARTLSRRQLLTRTSLGIGSLALTSLLNPQLFGSVNPVAGPYYNFTVPEPTGVVGVIAPEEPPDGNDADPGTPARDTQADNGEEEKSCLDIPISHKTGRTSSGAWRPAHRAPPVPDTLTTWWCSQPPRHCATTA